MHFFERPRQIAWQACPVLLGVKHRQHRGALSMAIGFTFAPHVQEVCCCLVWRQLPTVDGE